jgi:TonB family protein
MAAGTQVGWVGPSRRRVPRFAVQAPLAVTVLRSGIPDTLPGRSINLGERGIAAVLAGELLPGEAVGIEVIVPSLPDPLRTRAVVRYSDKLSSGFEFIGLSLEQRLAIRDWAKDVDLRTEMKGGTASTVRRTGGGASGAGYEIPERKPAARQRRKFRGWGRIVLLIVVAFGAGVFWWRWNRGWEELESGLKSQEAAAAEQPQAQVPAEVMEKLLVHRVEPVYPPEARHAKLQGIIALDIVVGRDGSVLSMHPLNGPTVLAQAAMDALRWWKFEPYRLNGEPATVETTVAVEFKR